MIYLEHLNLVVSDIPTTLAFYRAAFPHWQERGKGEGEWFGKYRHWVHFGDAYQYLTFNDDGEGTNRDLEDHQIGLGHFAFVTANLNSLVKRMTQAGYPVDKPGSEDPNRNNVYYIDPNGFEVEFVEYLSDNPAERNQYASIK